MALAKQGGGGHSVKRMSPGPGQKAYKLGTPPKGSGGAKGTGAPKGAKPVGYAKPMKMQAKLVNRMAPKTSSGKKPQMSEGKPRPMPKTTLMKASKKTRSGTLTQKQARAARGAQQFVGMPQYVTFKKKKRG